jgi:2-polyprenyl-3-methyl-5-hydroxy-6-metoxy-1,4-benzoquinol methylase
MRDEEISCNTPPNSGEIPATLGNRTELEDLRCPTCHSRLIPVNGHGNRSSDFRLRCNHCCHEYPLCNGFPLLWLPDDECVRIWNHHFKDHVLNESTLLGWESVRENPEHERLSLLRLEKVRAVQGSFFFRLMIIVSGVAGIASMFIQPHLFAWIIGIGLSTIICISLWHCWSEYRYYASTRANYFARQANRAHRLYLEGGLSERKHFGGGEQVFDHPVKVSEADCYPRSERQRIHDDFVVRKARFLQSRSGHDPFPGGRLLSVGCGGPSHQAVNRVFVARGCSLTGVDAQDYNVVYFGHAFRASAILANAMRLPLAEELFDGVILTDVLEHLHDPLAGLKEIHRVLKPGGVLVFTTNNRARRQHIINPVAGVRIGLGQWFPKLLPAREIMMEWDGKHFLHAEFARIDLIHILRASGFRRFRLETTSFTPPPSGWTGLGQRIISALGLGDSFFGLAWKQPEPDH